MIRNHDEYANEMSEEDKRRFINGELVIVTSNGDTSAVDSGRPNFETSEYKREPIVRPSYSWHGVERK